MAVTYLYVARTGLARKTLRRMTFADETVATRSSDDAVLYDERRRVHVIGPDAESFSRIPAHRSTPNTDGLRCFFFLLLLLFFFFHLYYFLFFFLLFLLFTSYVPPPPLRTVSRPRGPRPPADKRTTTTTTRSRESQIARRRKQYNNNK